MAGGSYVQGLAGLAAAAATEKGLPEPHNGFGAECDQAVDALVDQEGSAATGWIVAVISAMAGAEFCTIRVSPSQTLEEVAILARVARLEVKPLTDNVSIVFVADGKVLHEELTLEQVFPEGQDSSEPRVLEALEQNAEIARNILLRSRVDHMLAVLAGVHQLTDLSDTPFGEELAEQLYRAVLGGHALRGRVDCRTRDKILEQSRVVMWTLWRDQEGSTDRMQATFPRGLPREQVERLRQFTCFRSERYGDTMLLAFGEIVLDVDGRRETWRSKEAFVSFWASISEQRFAAYTMGVWHAKLGLPVLGGLQTDSKRLTPRPGDVKQRWVEDVPKMRQLQAWAKAHQVGGVVEEEPGEEGIIAIPAMEGSWTSSKGDQQITFFNGVCEGRSPTLQLRGGFITRDGCQMLSFSEDRIVWQEPLWAGGLRVLWSRTAA